MNVEQSKEINRLRRLSSLGRIGWWEADFFTKEYVCSEYLCKLLGIKDTNIISFYAFAGLIHEDYRDRITREFASIKDFDVYEQIFPVYSTQGVVWVRSRSEEKWISEDGHLTSFGVMEIVDMPDNDEKNKAILEQLNSLLLRQHSISHSLHHLLKDESLSETIPQILKDILDFFQADRVYIVEYNADCSIQNCTYEVVASGTEPIMRFLEGLDTSKITWWTEQMKSGKSLLLDSVSSLPPEAAREYEMFLMKGVKSVAAVPMQNAGKVWGCLGVDMVKQHHRWTNEDYQWISSLANIISICISLWRAKDESERERTSLSNLYHYMPLGYIRRKLILDEEGKVCDYYIEEANELSSRLCGYPMEAYRKKLASGFYTNEQMQQKLAVITEVHNTHVYKEVDEYFPVTGKTCRCVIYSPDPEEFVCLYMDITEMRKTYAALDHNEKLLQNIFSNIPVGVEIYDANGILTKVNPKDMELFGVKSQEEVLGVNFFDNPNMTEELRKRMHEEDEVYFPQNYRFDVVDEYYDTKKAGGMQLYTKISKMYDKLGEYLGFVLINIDNTERIEALNRISEFEKFFSLISDYARVGYAKINQMTGESYAVKQWYKNLGEENGTPLDQIVGVYNKMHPEDRDHLLDFFEKAKQGGEKNFKGEARILKPGKTDEWNWIRIDAVVNQCDSKTGKQDLIGVNYDITELKETEFALIRAKEKAEAADRLKSAFLANMSHEIRTPLNAIVGFSSLLGEAETPEERSEYLQIVEKNNQLLLQLISDILDLAKIEAGTFDFKYQQVDLNKLCKDLVASIKLRVKEGVELLFEETSFDSLCYSDPNRIHQVIANFVTNSIKFTNQGTIRIGCEKLDESYVRIYVKDTGVGISSDHCEQIFKRFVKLDTFVQGTGLGLPICKSIVEQLGGTIGVDSVEGEGSTFWFTLPLQTGS